MIARLLQVLLAALLSLHACGRQSDAIVVIALHPHNPNILYIATNDYIYKSRDEGRSWEKVSGGMTHSRVISMVIDPLYPATVYAGTKGDAVYKSYDGGQRWTAQKAGLDDVTFTSVVNQLLLDPTAVGTHPPQASSHPPAPSRPRQAPAPRDAPLPVNHLWAATSMGVFESMDGGDSWRKRMEGMKEVLVVVTVALDPVNPDIMYAGTSGGVYKSTDRAKTWAKVNSGLVSPEVLASSRALMVNMILLDPRRPETVYAATLNGLYKSGDGARSWSRIGETLPDQMINVMAMDGSGTVYVAGRQGVHKTSDSGWTWKAMNAGLASLNVRSLAISPRDPQTVYLGTNGSGLYRSRDGGETWTALPIVPAAP